jgi:hypothetical protein
MPPLGRTLQDYDLGHLRVIAELWGLDMPGGRAAEAAEALARRMLDSGEVADVLEALPEESRLALDDLATRGRVPLTELQLRFGPLRRTGPGRRDREQPWRDRTAVLDALWYRGLIGLAFFETPTGPREFAFIPDDLAAQLARPRPPGPSLVAASPPSHVLAGGGAADDVVTLLAALRRRPSRTTDLPPARAAALRPYLIHPDSLDMLVALLREMAVVVLSPLRPDPETTRRLLRSERGEIESSLRTAWLHATGFNDLAHIAHLLPPKSGWPNQPVPARTALEGMLGALEREVWYPIDAFLDHVRQTQPTFLRPGGDFDSWYLRERSSGRFLRGFENWETIDGAYLRFVLAGPLYWLGSVDLGGDEGDERPTRFRLRNPASSVDRTGEAPSLTAPAARVAADGRVFFPAGASLPHRYQVARFCDWIRRDATGFLYRLTPRALAAAQTQSLENNRVVRLLESAAHKPLPDNLQRSIGRWSQRGIEAVVESTLVLKTRDDATLRELRDDPATARYLEEILGPRTARVRLRELDSLLAAAARRGLLVQPPGARP